MLDQCPFELVCGPTSLFPGRFYDANITHIFFQSLGQVNGCGRGSINDDFFHILQGPVQHWKEERQKFLVDQGVKPVSGLNDILVFWDDQFPMADNGDNQKRIHLRDTADVLNGLAGNGSVFRHVELPQ